MKKAPDAFRTISEVSEILDTPAHVLRFWESKFYQVRPVKRAGGRRYYRPDDVALIAGIKHLLQDRGMTIRGVQKIMQEEGVRHVIGLGRSSGRIDVDAEAAPAEAVAEPAPQDPIEPLAEPPAPATAPPSSEPAAAPAPSAQPQVEAPAAATEPEPATPAPPAPGTARRPLPPLPDLDDITADDGPRLAQMLRGHAGASASAASLAPIAQRLDRLLDRMAEASGTRRW